MGMTIAIKDFEMPNTCGDCPCCIHTADEKRYIGYCNTSDDDYFCKALDRFMEYDKVDGGVDILGKPSDCPLVEAIPKAEVRKLLRDTADKVSDNVLDIVRKEYIPKSDYENRLKADMVAMLTEIQLELDEEIYDYKGADMDSEAYAVGRCKDIIQQKINALKGEGEK